MAGGRAHGPRGIRDLTNRRWLPLNALRAFDAVGQHLSFTAGAQALNVSRAEVHGVITFYHDFRDAPGGRHVLQICRAESCQAMGCEALVQRLRMAHRLEPGQTSANGALTIENVYCLGHCALSPAALLDGQPIGRLDEARIDALVLEMTGARA